MPRNCPNERRRDSDPGGGRNEIVKRQPDHLRKVRHRRFAGVILPVGVGGKTGCGVKRKIGTDSCQFLRIQGQKILQAQDRVGEQAAHETEEQHRQCVLLPIVLFAGVNTHRAIGEPLDWSQHRIEPRFAIWVENVHQIEAHWLCHQGERDQVNRELNPTRGLHGTLEFFRPDHGHEQIHEKQQCYDANNDRFHLSSYNFSQSTVYKAPNTKNAMITPMKIKSLIRVSISAT